MATSDLLRHQKINSLMTQPPEKVADAAIDLWGKMAIQIISIVGEGGNSLYAQRISDPVKLSMARPCRFATPAGSRFAQLKTHPGAPTFSCCNTGHLASGACFLPNEIVGNKNTRLYAGSMTEWTNLGNPTVG